MLDKCGSKCFLGDGTSYPVCGVTRRYRRPSCRISTKGLRAAKYVAGRMRNYKVEEKADKLLKKRRTARKR